MYVLEQQIFSLFDVLEINLKDEVVLDGTEIKYFYNAATDHFLNTRFDIADLILEQIPAVISTNSDLSVLPPIALCADILELARILAQSKERFPLASEFADGETVDGFNWQPIYDALRSYFDEDVISLISSRYEFDLARESFLRILEISPNFYADGEFDAFRFNVFALKQCELAEVEDKEALNRLLEILIPPEPVITIPIVREYEGSTGGLEPRFLEWLEQHFKSESIFDDEDFDFDAPLEEEDINWNNLLASWLESGSYSPTMFENYLWIPIDVRAEVDYEF